MAPMIVIINTIKAHRPSQSTNDLFFISIRIFFFTGYSGLLEDKYSVRPVIFMGKFDFIECASKSYEYIWEHRAALFKQSIPALLLKCFCFIIVITFELETSMLRQGLVLLPSFFLEGWIVAHIILLAAQTEQNAAYKLPIDNFKFASNNIIASMIIYVLIKIAIIVAFGVPHSYIDPEQSAADSAAMAETGMGYLFILILSIIFTVWAFRFLWLYIPVVLGFSPGKFLYKIRGMLSSVYLIATWLFCFIPAGLVLLFLTGFLAGLMPNVDDAPGLPEKYTLGLIHAVFDYLTVLLSSLGIAYGVSSIFNKEDKNVSLL